MNATYSAPTDVEAMDAIAELMSGAEWNPDLLDAIADIVRSTGRDLEDIA
jgi:hypothetical protein